MDDFILPEDLDEFNIDELADTVNRDDDNMQDVNHDEEDLFDSVQPSPTISVDYSKQLNEIVLKYKNLKSRLRETDSMAKQVIFRFLLFKLIKLITIKL